MLETRMRALPGTALGGLCSKRRVAQVVSVVVQRQFRIREMTYKCAAVLFVGEHVPRYGARVPHEFVRVQIREKFPQVVFGNALV